MKKIILLVDVDSKIPNLALMKISNHYKEYGYEVELQRLNYSYYPKERNCVIINADIYEKVFVSVIFPINKKVVKVLNCDDVHFGGSGYNLDVELDPIIDFSDEDYSLYDEKETSYGFLTRGCIRNCAFCFVPKKEGKLRKYRDVKDIVKHKKAKFMDNNILAYDKADKILQELVDMKLKCQFNQGLDIRLLTEKKSELLSKMNYWGEYFFAFDDIRYEKIIQEKYDLFRKHVPKDWKVKFFIYCNANMPIKDVVYRVNWCKENKALPYLMRDINCWESQNKEFYIDLCAYCNQPSIFKKMTFEEFMEKRTNNLLRRKESINKYRGELLKPSIEGNITSLSLIGVST